MLRNVTQFIKKRHLSYIVILLVMGGVWLVGTSTLHSARASGNDTLYLSPSSGSHNKGTTFSVAIHENSNTDQVNAAEADLTYPTAKLQYVSTSLSGTAFGVTAGNTGGSGSVSVELGSTSALTGDKLVATVTFKALANGSASVAFASSSSVLSSSSNTNVATSITGGSYSIVTPTTVKKPTPPTTHSGGGGGTTTKPPTTKPSAAPTVTSIAPQNNPTPVSVPNNAKVEIKSPVTVQTTPANGKQVSKVEYYLNNKLVATVTASPYNYSVNTKELRNGNYTLAAKTFYANGTTSTQNTALVVKNPFGWVQFGLDLRHYAWAIVFVLVIVALVWFLWRRIARQLNPYGPSSSPPAANPGADVHVSIM